MDAAPGPHLSLLFPRPQHVRQLGDAWRLPRLVTLAGAESPCAAVDALERALHARSHGLRRSLEPHAGVTIQLRLAPLELEQRLVEARATEPLPPHALSQGYAATLSAGAISIVHGGAAGLQHALSTLVQLVTLSEGAPGELCLPSLAIEDFPDFRERGVMLDISRDRVPTLDTLRALIDRLALWKLNQLQLYMEHTFAYVEHERVWRDASPLTAQEVRELDAYCAARQIELVPNQNSFGHMHRWLVHEPYRALAECPEGFEHPWNWTGEPYGLCATDPASLRFLEGLYDELLPNFRSRLFNVGLDETIDLGAGRSRAACEALGAGRVYLEFLQQVHARVKQRGRIMQFWGDIVVQRPELIPELPRDAIALEWGYEADHPYAEHLLRFQSEGLQFYVCPGTSSWNSIAGRTENAILNIALAAREGKAAGALGLLVTDWGDHGHLQPLAVSYLGLLLGAGLSWNVSDAAQPFALDLPRLLDEHVFLDRAGVLGRVAYDLGNSYREAGSPRANSSVLFWSLLKPDRLFTPPGVTQQSLERTLAYIDRVSEPLSGARPDGTEGQRAVAELGWASDLLRLSCRLGIARCSLSDREDLTALPPATRRELSQELTELLERQRSLWLARSRPGGLEDSLRRLTSALDALRG